MRNEMLNWISLDMIMVGIITIVAILLINRLIKFVYDSPTRKLMAVVVIMFTVLFVTSATNFQNQQTKQLQETGLKLVNAIKNK